MIQLADPKYNGTLERRIALILDHNIIGNGRNDTGFILLSKNGLEGLVNDLAAAVRQHLETATQYKINGAGDVYRKNGKVVEVFLRGQWAPSILDGVWDLSVLKMISESEAKRLTGE